MPTIGFIGNKVDLLIRQGATFGPHTVTLTNPNNTAVNLTGATVRGSVVYEGGSTPFDVTVTDAPGGVFTIGLTADVTAELPGGDHANDPAGRHKWDLELVDSLDRVTPIFYGIAQVFNET